MENLYDVIIIGSGPAGMTASVYASRAGLKTLLLEHDAPGGKLVKTVEIQNWPGIVEAEGTSLAIDMFTHSTAYGATFDGASINALTTDADAIHTLTSADGRTFKTRTVIIATGTLERSFDLPKVMRIYIHSLISHKHKSNVDDLIKIARRELDAISEISVSEAGVDQYTPEGKLRTQVGLKRMKESLDYAIKAFQGGQLHTPEGRSSKKRLSYLEKKEPVASCRLCWLFS